MIALRAGGRIAADRSQQVAAGLLWLLAAALVLGLALPLAAILGKALTGDDGRFAGLAQFAAIVGEARFWDAVSNSLAVSLTTTMIVLPLAYVFAAALTRTCMPAKPLFRALALTPLLAPSLLPGIALVYLFGNQGLLKAWFPDGSIYGFWGIVIAEVFFTFPHALMILVTALSVADARLYEAATALGAGRIRRFVTVTLPAARYGLISSALVVFTLVIVDFGAPKVIGGQYNVLAVEVYKQVIGQQNFPKGAVIGMLLLLPAVLAFVIDHLLQRRQRALLTARAQPLVVRPQAWVDVLSTVACAAIGGALLVIIATAVAAAFIRLWPYNLSLTLAHFDFDNMDGGGWAAFYNSMKMALATSVIGTLMVFGGAYLAEKTRAAPVARQLLKLLAIIPMAVPGLVLGLGYILFFNNPANPLHFLYGSMTALVLCSVMHFYTTANLTATTALKQLDAEFEAVAASLKVPFWTTLWRVTLPVCLPAMLDIARFYFVSAMCTVSAVIFIYTPDTVLASVAVLNMDDAGDTAAAAAMATLIVAASALICLVFSVASWWLSRRTQAWRIR
ncbi:putative 2-aminoethylphosphonate ABC transporter permease subunit [Jeongeupia naejangsanensis]|uniref:2-aminoethylphosphonate ABC transporter permease subunit n=1 Tax=Jeongeupia naejangsanensis TaxID=613195 RepID=A0ABS2BIY7_9NEIS|nr:putative 2-aminoethylphosphonate ABC transporter permease subunit [Jeongeupia naejangsanensis]MBM3115405.1 putative 2-aminoethylphosphonate ABC transporter permease subunit [Jeongeupia naejangsanensis]